MITDFYLTSIREEVSYRSFNFWRLSHNMAKLSLQRTLGKFTDLTSYPRELATEREQ